MAGVRVQPGFGPSSSFNLVPGVSYRNDFHHITTVLHECGTVSPDEVPDIFLPASDSTPPGLRGMLDLPVTAARPRGA